MTQVHYNMKKNVVEIHLSGTRVDGPGNPSYGEGSIGLTAYGARSLAYELLSKANDAEHYSDKRSGKTMKWKNLPPDNSVRVKCDHSEICDAEERTTCPHAEPHYPVTRALADGEQALTLRCNNSPITCNAGSDGDIICVLV